MTRCVAVLDRARGEHFSFAPGELALDGERWHHREMGKGKPTPDKAKTERAGEGESEDRARPGSESDAPASSETSALDSKTALTPANEAASTSEPPAIEPPAPKAEPWPDATPQPMRPVEPPPTRSRAETMAMPPELVVGAPPEVPVVKSPGTVEDPTHMPGPRDIPPGSPNDPAAPPGRVPSGDSRSLRKASEFALVYRVQTAVISRFGVVGTRGQWRVVDYPTSSSASNAFAKEVSRFVSEGFSDYRD